VNRRPAADSYVGTQGVWSTHAPHRPGTRDPRRAMAPGGAPSPAGPGARQGGHPSLDELGVELDDPRTALVLALADDELVTGHRHSHWTGVAPSLEEDIAFSGIAQDEINHADVWYQQLAPEGAEPSQVRLLVDRLALGRDPDQYRHAVLCERPPREIGFTLVRHWLYDHADAVRLTALVGSSDHRIAAAARRLLHEERYHLEHADTWFTRLAHADDHARSRVAGALRAALPEAVLIFEPLTGEEELVERAVLPAPSRELLVRWLDLTAARLGETGLTGELAPLRQDDSGGWELPDDLFAEPSGRHGRHTADFIEDVWPEMTALHRAHPGAVW
jgi:ring-1,2-phenylacetyl-CoA epoxidase subunit PaaC